MHPLAFVHTLSLCVYYDIYGPGSKQRSGLKRAKLKLTQTYSRAKLLSTLETKLSLNDKEKQFLTQKVDLWLIKKAQAWLELV